MNKQIDHDSVVWMAKTGFHPEAISERLGCSRRQVDRILTEQGVKAKGWMKDFKFEKNLWKHYRNVYFESYAKIARRFGVSREAVRKYFSDQYAVSSDHYAGVVTADGRPLHLIEDAEFEIQEAK